MQDDTDDLVVALTYYSPYVSGLTNVAKTVVEALAERGRRVTVVTTRHEPSLPSREIVNGVQVLRAPVWRRVGKGTISPGFTQMVRSAARRAKVVNLHLPMLEAGVIATACPAPVVLTYHCDVALPPGVLNHCQQRVIDASSRLAMRHATATVVSSADYALHSRLYAAMAPGMVTIPPPCPPVSGGRPTYREGEGYHIGFLGRIVEEKGLVYLVQAFRRLGDPAARLLIGGDFAQVAGGSVINDVQAAMRGDQRIRLLGFVPEDRLADLYASMDLLVLPSINSFEAFGIVQVVAMLAGVPVIVSDLPGVRVPVQQTGFGEIVAPRDVDGLHAALARWKDHHVDTQQGRTQASLRYDVNLVIDEYDALFEKAAGGTRRRRVRG